MLRSSDSDFLALQEALAGRYSLEQELGRGGMGVVYLARDVRLDRPVAIKLLPPRFAAQPVLRERFLREARTAAKLSHPNIVPIHLVDEVGDFVFFVMAFVEGETLGSRVRERGPLRPTDAARILREVAWALSYAHAQGVVHRDVKPDNILLEAGSGRAMVTDFGIAWVGESAGLTSVGEVLGTPEFMSPEQASGERVDGRSDLYALGIVGHHALSGRLPFQGASAQATLARQLTQPAPPLASVAPGVPGALAKALDRCLAKDPAERFQGGEELAEALGDVLRERRQTPSAIRAFAEETQGQTGGMIGSALGALWCLLLVILGLAEGGTPAAVIAVVGALGAAFAATPLALLVHRARDPLGRGHEHDEVVRALRADVEERRADVAVLVEQAPSAVDRWLRRVTAGGLVVVVVFLLGLAFGPYVALPPIIGALILGLYFGGFTAFVVGGLAAAIRSSGTRDVRGARWLAFWEGPVGRAIFRLAEVGLERRLPAAGSYRPTEVAIGMAAERLFAELPTDVRRSLGDLPGVVAALEAHAERTRTRLDELDRVLGDIGERGTTAGPLPERRESLAEEVGAARDAAEARLREVVAALESVRLELLRLHAGSGTVESMTADLGAARALADDMERLGEARGEVRKMLRRPIVTPPEPDTPVPA